MKDVSALMGKLNTKVGYQQFEDEAGQEQSSWPVLRRVAEAKKRAAGGENPSEAEVPVPPAPPPELPLAKTLLAKAAALASAPAAVVQALPAAPSNPPAAKLLRRYAGPGSSPDAAQTPSQDQPPALSDIFANLERKTR